MSAGRREQGRLIAEYARTALGHLSSRNGRAECVRRKLVAYASTAWLQERTLTEPPGERHAPFWQMLKAFDCVPSVKTILRKLDKL
jgi:hypothetical protein